MSLQLSQCEKGKDEKKTHQVWDHSDDPHK